MKEIDAFKAKIIDIIKLMIGTINYDCSRLITDLDFKEKSTVKRVKLMETKLKRQNMFKDCFLIKYQVNSVVFMIYI